ncbi:stress-induced protein YchH [Lonsdalea quercina]|uniref:DUF2583 domain-containing protein n=1 Tax=Lonsdalea quercina TaxID=71657 RepID=A0A1H3XVR7_9GAMM|nr:stress-induced protein YchH [Lonsdalea quercina]SEA03310.1 Protein of unknown function [Lonsdalea quercina]
MKRKHAVMTGNLLMSVGLVLMVASVGYAIISQLPGWHLPGSGRYLDLMGIFSGAIVWLIGARLGGRDTVSDRYWWVKHFDKRCRRTERLP